MTHEVKKIRKYSKGWIVYVQTTSLGCGCNVKPMVMTFNQEKEPTVEQIENEIKNRR